VEVGEVGGKHGDSTIRGYVTMVILGEGDFCNVGQQLCSGEGGAGLRHCSTRSGELNQKKQYKARKKE